MEGTPVTVSYGSFDFTTPFGSMPVPFVSRSQEVLYQGKKWGQSTSITLNGTIIGTSGIKAGDVLNYTAIDYDRNVILDKFSRDYKPLQLREGGTLVTGYDYCIVNNVDFEVGNAGKLDYTIELTCYDKKTWVGTQGVLDPVDEYSFRQISATDIELSHKVSARGYQNDTAALQNAINFVNARTGVSSFSAKSRWSIPVEHFVLKTVSKDTNRPDATYSVTETYAVQSGDISVTTLPTDNVYIPLITGVVQTFSTSFSSGANQDFSTVSVDYAMQGNKKISSSDLRSKLPDSGVLYDIANSALPAEQKDCKTYLYGEYILGTHNLAVETPNIVPAQWTTGELVCISQLTNNLTAVVSGIATTGVTFHRSSIGSVLNGSLSITKCRGACDGTQKVYLRPVSYSVNDLADTEHKIEINAQYTDNFVGQINNSSVTGAIYWDYKIDYSTDAITNVTTATIGGEFKSTKNTSARQRYADISGYVYDTLATSSKAVTGFVYDTLVGDSQIGYDALSGSHLSAEFGNWPINPALDSFNIRNNKRAGTISMEASFNNENWLTGFREATYSVEYNPSIEQYATKPSCNLNGLYGVYDLNVLNRQKINLSQTFKGGYLKTAPTVNANLDDYERIASPYVLNIYDFYRQEIPFTDALTESESRSAKEAPHNEVTYSQQITTQPLSTSWLTVYVSNVQSS